MESGADLSISSVCSKGKCIVVKLYKQKESGGITKLERRRDSVFVSRVLWNSWIMTKSHLKIFDCLRRVKRLSTQIFQWLPSAGSSHPSPFHTQVLVTSRLTWLPAENIKQSLEHLLSSHWVIWRPKLTRELPPAYFCVQVWESAGVKQHKRETGYEIGFPVRLGTVYHTCRHCESLWEYLSAGGLLYTTWAPILAPPLTNWVTWAISFTFVSLFLCLQFPQEMGM